MRFTQIFMRNTRSQSGFSLVELSVVLIILGLLVGGILGGQSLIHAASLRKVTSEFNEYHVQINTFQLQYDALPGDFREATRYWGGTDCSAWVSARLSGPIDFTCNGTGDGHITTGSPSFEVELHWQHLHLAGLMKENMHLHLDSSLIGSDAYYDGNYPASSFERARWQVIDFNTSIASSRLRLLDNDRFGNYLFFSSPLADGKVALSPTDAWNIDSKVDDGKPATGNVIAPSGEAPSSTYLQMANTPDCTIRPSTGASTTPGDMDAEYKLSYDGDACVLLFQYPN